MEKQEGQFITSEPTNLFFCPYCNSEFETKEYFMIHLSERHPNETQNISMEAINKLESYKTNKSNTLNI